MKKIISVTLLLLLTTPCLLAQRKELGQARSYIKSGKDYDKAEKLMTDLLARDAESRDNKKVYMMWFQAVQKQYDVGNEKLYLHQAYDTTAFFSLTRRMFTILERLDSIDMRPDEKGRVAPEHRRDNARVLSAYRPNLYNGGTFHLRKGNYRQAYDFFETYVDCDRQPLFTDYDLAATDPRMAEAAYWATYCGFRLDAPDLVLRHHELAERDSSKLSYTLQYMGEAYRALGDDSLYHATLQRGFALYPANPYFFPRLTDYYTARGELEQALGVADRALATDSLNTLFLFAKSTMLLNLARYAESIEYSDKVIALDPANAEAYFNAGSAWQNLAMELDPLKDKAQLRDTYEHARPYMEKYREMAPGEQQKWAPALYRIYLNLNMGRQFDEIDRLLK